MAFWMTNKTKRAIEAAAEEGLSELLDVVDTFLSEAYNEGHQEGYTSGYDRGYEDAEAADDD